MQLKDLTIGTQLRLGLGVVMVLVVALGVMAWRESDLLWLQSKTLYDHPLQVRRAIGALEVKIVSMSRHARDLFIARDEREMLASLHEIEVEKIDAEAQFAILQDRYLGPRSDLNDLREVYLKWNLLRDETVRLLREGQTAAAAARVRRDGVQDVQAKVVLSRLRKVDDSAWNHADQLYRESTATNQALNRQLVVVVASILLLSGCIGWLLLGGIRNPLRQLTTATDQFRRGRMDARTGYASANEFGALAASFNAMAATIQTEMTVKEQTTQLAGVMLREEEAHAFCRELLRELLRHTGSQLGAVYFLNAAGTAFEHFESIGLGAAGRAAFSATQLEGELGAALATRRIQRITDIPADTRFVFAAVSGDFKPREILTIPALSGEAVTAVVSLASIRPYDATAIRLVDDIWSVLTARVNGVLSFRKIQELVARLEDQNRALDAAKEELKTFASELTETNAELEMQKRQLDEANRLKSAFLSNMSHELRTPLNSVIALTGVLGRRLATTIPAEEYSYLEVIERNGKNLLALINDILDLSRIEAGREEINVSQFSMLELTDEIVAMLEPLAVEKKITLRNELTADLPLIANDPVKCRHILQNLIGNAVKFTEQGQVTISARQMDREIHIIVTDTGIGITAAHLPHIFDEFRQADDSTSRKYGGTGLGLAIARKYARLLGGSIVVRSMPDEGSVFTLRLPLVFEGSGPAHPVASRHPFGQHPALPPAPAPGQGRTILVVEDSEPAIVQLTEVLQAEGYRVLVARNGREALVQIRHTQPDALILDLMMPEVDGFQVLREIRAVERTAHLPVLILTAKHVTREELSFLEGNKVHQLIQKGDINKAGLLAEVARMMAPVVRPIRRRPARPGKPVVLVAENDPDNMRSMRALLSGIVEVVEAVDGRSAVEQARTHRPDLILTDIAMPVMDGFAELEAIRADEALRNIPVVAVTASAMTGNREKILDRGFDAYLSKPVEHTVLMKTLREFLDWENE